jgi:hypothetical protein
MPKIGVYIACGPNPIFLRLCMMQLARQSVLPQFVSIFENGNKTSAFNWACQEVVRELEIKGVKIIHIHSAAAASSVVRYYESLKILLQQTDTDVFLKWDLDDFYSDNYIKNMSESLGGHDVAINQNCGITLVRPFHGDFKFKTPVVMKHSPIGAAPSHIVFNRRFALKYRDMLAEFKERADVADDELMADCFPEMSVHRFDGPADYIYVSHGNNWSSYAWQSTGGRVYLD